MDRKRLPFFKHQSELCVFYLMRNNCFNIAFVHEIFFMNIGDELAENARYICARLGQYCMENDVFAQPYRDVHSA